MKILNDFAKSLGQKNPLILLSGSIIDFQPKSHFQPVVGALKVNVETVYVFPTL